MNSYYLNDTCYIHCQDPLASTLVGSRLTTLLTQLSSSPPLLLCIGSDKVIGDSLGPLVGSFLKKATKKAIPIYGSLEMPIHALNLKEVNREIRLRYPDRTVIALDASLGTPGHLGYITVSPGSLYPGAGVEKSLDAVGDICITGITAPEGRFPHLALQATSHSTIIDMAQPISAGILQALQSFSDTPHEHGRYDVQRKIETALG